MHPGTRGLAFESLRPILSAGRQEAERAEKELPGQVDPERDKGILEKIGIDPNDLLGNLGGGLGEKLGI